MKLQILLLLICVVCLAPLKSQEKLKVIRANSSQASLQVNNSCDSGNWHISPEMRPDIFTVGMPHARVKLITDLDSFICKVKPGKQFNFVVLLNGRDSAYTRIFYEPSGYLRTLQQAATYRFDENSPQNPYPVIDFKDQELIRFRNTFHLDSIAGKGSEVSKIVNLMLWLHKSVVYDGSKEVPPYANITDLLQHTLLEKGTFHCGIMASTMEQCYQAMGFKARRIICFPKDSNDFECHSIVTVYAPSLHKWLYMDPVHAAYFTDKKGNLLSIAEVRDYLIRVKEIRMNKDANLNGHPENLNYYLYNYMAKNLYALQCFSKRDGNSVSNLLLPPDYLGDFTHTRSNHPKVTHNPNVFWDNMQ